jgi:hypothetical protein
MASREIGLRENQQASTYAGIGFREAPGWVRRVGTARDGSVQVSDNMEEIA